jgi:hypothetical protein
LFNFHTPHSRFYLTHLSLCDSSRQLTAASRAIDISLPLKFAKNATWQHWGAGGVGFKAENWKAEFLGGSMAARPIVCFDQ